MRNGVIVAGMLGLGLLGSACGGGGSATPEAAGGQPTGMPSSPPMASPPVGSPPMASPGVSGSAMPSAGAAMLEAKTVSIGTILVDGQGRTLYAFEKDKGQGGKSTCGTACAKEWPPFVAMNRPAAGAGVQESWIGMSTRADGTKQVTYHGWPLYYYYEDKAAGEMKGQGVSSFGAPWYVVGAKTGEPLKK